jgi:hypothetical protein
VFSDQAQSFISSSLEPLFLFATLADLWLCFSWFSGLGFRLPNFGVVPRAREKKQKGERRRRVGTQGHGLASCSFFEVGTVTVAFGLTLGYYVTSYSTPEPDGGMNGRETHEEKPCASVRVHTFTDPQKHEVVPQDSNDGI